MENFVAQFMRAGAIGAVAYILFKNTLAEKKEDRDLYVRSVDTFTEVTRQFADSIQGLSSEVKNVEKGNERIEQKLDNVINRLEE